MVFRLSLSLSVIKSMVVMIDMNHENIVGLEVSLLLALDALLRERQVTRAAQRLGLTQSAMSHALRRLRELFGDPLFVRTPRGVLPTPRAAQLAEPLARVLAELERLTARPAAFDPATLTRRMALLTSEYVDVVLLPQLLAQLLHKAPRLDLEVRGTAFELEGALEEGRVDVALGIFPQLSPRVMQQRLFEDRFVCLLRTGHPAARGRLSLSRYAALSHVQIAPRGAPGGPVDEALGKRGLQRRVAVRIGSFLSALQLVARSDLLLTAPERLVRALLGTLPLRVLEPPLELPRFAIYQVWHERRQEDPAHAWLRSVLAEIARSLQPPGAAP